MDLFTLPVHADPARDFVVELLHTGLGLTDLVASLLESTPPDAFPGEDAGDVLIEMVAGSLRPALAAAGPETLSACAALLGALRDRTSKDLQEAARRGRARERTAARRSRPGRR